MSASDEVSVRRLTVFP
jgi:hypothetical protein